MKKILYLIVVPLIFLSARSFPKAVSYEDVAVIVNQDNPLSVEIANYFALKRGIPENNMITISCTSDEDIDSTGFEDIRRQVEQQIEEKGMLDRINYLVTTKGLPLNVMKADNCEGITGVTFCSSFDSEISLLFSPWSDKILKKNAYVVNPYYLKTNHFTRQEYGIFLVTRLDGYSVEDVKNLIDRSGPDTFVDKTYAKFIIDFSYITDTALLNLFTEFINPAIDLLHSYGWKVVFHPELPLLEEQEDVFGYYSINYQPTDKDLNFYWLKGSVSEILLSTGNLTFYDSLNVLNELAVPDLIAGGATSSSTYVNSAFFSKIIKVNELYGRYLDENVHPHFNLAESYFMAMNDLSYQHIIVGDPKTSLNIQQSSNIEEKNPEPLTLYPNPSSGNLNAVWYASRPGTCEMMIQDITGRVVMRSVKAVQQGVNKESFDVQSLPDGIYFFLLNIPGQQNLTYKFIKRF
jgi:uncharacterized protein (TIGR03790 family)